MESDTEAPAPMTSCPVCESCKDIGYCAILAARDKRIEALEAGLRRVIDACGWKDQDRFTVAGIARAALQPTPTEEKDDG